LKLQLQEFIEAKLTLDHLPDCEGKYNNLRSITGLRPR